MPRAGTFISGIRQELDAELAAYLPKLAEALPVERVYLFGSHARGDVHELSDLDLIVIAQTELPFLERMRIALECYPERRRNVELFVYTPQEWQQMVERGQSFARMVLEEGKVVYEREHAPDQ